MVDYEQINKLLSGTGSAVAEAISVLYPFNEIFYQDARTMVLSFAALMFVLSIAIYTLSAMESKFNPKAVITNTAISLVLLFPISTTSSEMGDETGTDNIDKTYPLAAFVGWKAVNYLIVYTDKALNTIEAASDRHSNNLLDNSYSNVLLNTYKEINVANNVNLYRKVCGPYANGQKSWDDSFGQKPSDEEFRAVGLGGAFLGFDPKSRNELEQFDDSFGKLFDVDSYTDDDGDTSITGIISGVISLSDLGGFGLIGSLFSEPQDEGLDALSRIPNGESSNDLFMDGLLIPTRKYLLEINKNGLVLDPTTGLPSGETANFMKNTTMPSSYDNRNQTGAMFSQADIAYRDNLFYPDNCAELYEVARKSVVHAMAANLYYTEQYGAINEFTADRLNNIGVSRDVISINSLAMGAFYDNDQFGEFRAGTDLVGLFESITGFFKSISTDFNAASIFGWCVLILAFLVNVFPFVAIVSALNPGLGQVYLVYAQLVLSLALTLIFLRMINYATGMLYNHYVGAMQLQIIASGDVSQVNGAILMSVHYGSLLVVAAATTGSWMFVSGKLSQLSSGNSHAGETAGAAAFVVTKMAAGAAGALAGSASSSFGSAKDPGDTSFTPPSSPSSVFGPGTYHQTGPSRDNGIGGRGGDREKNQSNTMTDRWKRDFKDMPDL